ncbi:MAG: aspartate/glutamate racemase family protein [Proteobacteria bacterium]|nr:aspartate/glutamate racemase family protein [Pseudomonadota bacterium]
MWRAVVINPNTSPTMTGDIAATAKKVFQPPWSLQTVNAPSGPESLESWRDYHLAAVAVLPLIEQHRDADGFVLACFGDPGLYALKEVSSVPVVGIAEAAISLSLLLGGRFGIVAGMTRSIQLMDSMVRQYGVESRYAGTSALNLRVLSLEEDRAQTIGALERAGRELAARGADVLLLGCAGLTDFVDEVRERIPVTIIDPVAAGCYALKMIIEAGQQVSHSGIYTRPAPQRMQNLEHVFSPFMVSMLKTWETDGA